MMFDRFAKEVEASADLASIMIFDDNLLIALEKTKLFYLPFMENEEVGNTVEKQGVEFIRKTFFLPFNYVGIEDHRSLVCLFEQPNTPPGLSNPKLVAMFQQFVPGNVAGFDWLLTLDSFVSDLLPDGRFANILGSQYLIYKKNGTLFSPNKKAPGHSNILYSDDANRLFSKEFREEIAGDIQVTYQQIIWMNDPTRFTIEQTDLHNKVPIGRKIRRSNEREIYTVMTAKKIRETILPRPIQSDKKVAPHERRRHYKVLRSPIFRWKHGQVVPVKACWVGSTEAIIGRKRYRVMLEN